MLKKLKEKLKWLDPFTYVDLYLMPIVNPKKNESVSLLVYLVSAFVFAFLIFNFLGLVLGTSSPMVIVVSNSMEPVLFRGDVVIISGVKPADLKAETVNLPISLLDSFPLEEYAVPMCLGSSGKEVECKNLPNTCPPNYNTSSIQFGEKKIGVNTFGDIIVYNSNVLNEPIIHRVVAKINAADGVYLLTKGDNKCNAKIDQQIGINRGAVRAEKIEGRAIFWFPKIGCIKLWVFDDFLSLVLTGKLP
ncbi:MAG: hypothetical protein HYW50_05325, partial [Candidatus Diapherotrites archaeon]|nr:hypothetical protein [Candidatus Diapherotrites archaeon]